MALTTTNNECGCASTKARKFVDDLTLFARDHLTIPSQLPIAGSKNENVESVSGDLESLRHAYTMLQSGFRLMLSPPSSNEAYTKDVDELPIMAIQYCKDTLTAISSAQIYIRRVSTTQRNVNEMLGNKVLSVKQDALPQSTIRSSSDSVGGKSHHRKRSSISRALGSIIRKHPTRKSCSDVPDRPSDDDFSAIVDSKKNFHTLFFILQSELKAVETVLQSE
jgi:hypothetical protein